MDSENTPVRQSQKNVQLLNPFTLDLKVLPILGMISLSPAVLAAFLASCSYMAFLGGLYKSPLETIASVLSLYFSAMLAEPALIAGIKLKSEKKAQLRVASKEQVLSKEYLCIRRSPSWRKPLIFFCLPGAIFFELNYGLIPGLILLFTELSKFMHIESLLAQSSAYFYITFAYVPLALTYRFLKPQKELDEKIWILEAGIIKGGNILDGQFTAWQDICSANLLLKSGESSSYYFPDKKSEFKLVLNSSSDPDYSIEIFLQYLSFEELNVLLELLLEKTTNLSLDAACLRLFGAQVPGSDLLSAHAELAESADNSAEQELQVEKKSTALASNTCAANLKLSPKQFSLKNVLKSFLFYGLFLPAILTIGIQTTVLYIEEITRVFSAFARGEHCAGILSAFISSIFLAEPRLLRLLSSSQTDNRKQSFDPPELLSRAFQTQKLRVITGAPPWRRPLIFVTAPGLVAFLLFYINVFVVLFLFGPFIREAASIRELIVFVYGLAAFLPLVVTYRLIRLNPDRDMSLWILSSGLALGYTKTQAMFLGWEDIEQVDLQQLNGVNKESYCPDILNQHQLTFRNKAGTKIIRQSIKRLNQYERLHMAELIAEKLGHAQLSQHCKQFLLDPLQDESEQVEFTAESIESRNMTVIVDELVDIKFNRAPGFRDEDFNDDDMSQHDLVLIDKHGRRLRLAVKQISSAQKRKSLAKLLSNKTQALSLDAKTRSMLEQLGISSKEKQISAGSLTELWESELKNQISRTNYVPLDKEASLQNGRYIIINHLRSGGFSTTYLARDEREEKNVVIKESAIPAGLSQEAVNKLSELFAREARLIQRCSHERILRILDFFHEERREYIVLEQIDGIPLSVLKPTDLYFKEEQVIAWSIEMADFLMHLHGLDPPIIHRDFTPDNILLHSSGHLYLIDFGAANEFIGQATGTLIGKQSYIAPEQFQGKASPASDIYSLGATLHYLLTGRDPLPLSTSHPCSLNAGVSAKLDEIVARATELDAAKRLASAHELKTQLQALAKQEV